MITGIEAEFCIMKHLKEKSLYFFLRPFFSRGINLFVSRRPSSCYRSQSSFSQGILKSVSWPFLIVQNVFSFVARWGGGAGVGQLCPSVGSVSVGFRLAWTGALGSRGTEQWGAGAPWPGWPSAARFVIYSVKPSFSGEILFRPPRENWKPLHKHWSVGVQGQLSPGRSRGCFQVLPSQQWGASSLRRNMQGWPGNVLFLAFWWHDKI